LVSEIEAYRRMLSVLNESGIDYMIVGSFAAIEHGHIRTTHDLDLVVVLSPEQVDELVETLGDEFYLDRESAHEAIERRDMFNAIHFDNGVKVDFFALDSDDEFKYVQFSRRRCIDFAGIPAFVETPEDTILSKLRWYRLTPSERQLTDVQEILRLWEGQLDWNYIDTWAKSIGVDDLLDQVRKEL